MTATDVALVLLAAVDLLALGIGISIRRRLTRIVRETAGAIEQHVKAGISDAVGKIAAVAGELLRSQGRSEVAERVLEELRPK